MDQNKSDDINSFDGEYVAFKEEIVIKIRWLQLRLQLYD